MLDILILTNLIHFCGIISSFMALYIHSLSMLRKALLKLMSKRWMEILNSFVFSKIYQKHKNLIYCRFS